MVKGAEGYQNFKARVKKTFEQILMTNEKVLVVAHSGIMHALLEILNISIKDVENCVPYLFTPPCAVKGCWSVSRM